MPSNKRQRWREKKKQERALNQKNEYGNNDPTPYQALRRIIKEQNLKVAR